MHRFQYNHDGNFGQNGGYFGEPWEKYGFKRFRQLFANGAEENIGEERF